MINQKIRDAAWFVLVQAKESGVDDLDDETMNKYYDTISYDGMAELTEDGFKVVPEGVTWLSVALSEKSGVIFVEAHYRAGEQRIPSRYASMAADQKKAREMYEQALDVIIAA